MSGAVPIAEQVDAVATELRRIEYNHPARPLTVPVQAEKRRRLGAALATLRTIAAHADGLRALISYLRRVAPDLPPDGAWDDDQMPGPCEAQALLAAPGVRAVLEHFPEAVLTAVRPVSGTPPPDAAAPESIDHAYEHEGELT